MITTWFRLATACGSFETMSPPSPSPPQRKPLPNRSADVRHDCHYFLLHRGRRCRSCQPKYYYWPSPCHCRLHPFSSKIGCLALATLSPAHSSVPSFAISCSACGMRDSSARRAAAAARFREILGTCDPSRTGCRLRADTAVVCLSDGFHCLLHRRYRQGRHCCFYHHRRHDHPRDDSSTIVVSLPGAEKCCCWNKCSCVKIAMSKMTAAMMIPSSRQLTSLLLPVHHPQMMRTPPLPPLGGDPSP
mmetsp:Transcript_12043/g.34861  ORF Transcript_12043/g.34861 Transcript_12043/m.34861 type:complete len:246 (-) Transcript_12043:1880-2617(-)